MAQKTLLKAYQKLSKILYNSHRDLGNIIKLMVVCFLKNSEWAKAVEFSFKYYEMLTFEFEEFDIDLFNKLFVLYYSFLKLIENKKEDQEKNKKAFHQLVQQIKKFLEFTLPDSS